MKADKYGLYYEGSKLHETIQCVPFYVRYKLFKKESFYSNIEIILFVSLFLIFYFTEVDFIFPAMLFILLFFSTYLDKYIDKSKRYEYFSGIITKRIGNTIYLLTDDYKNQTKEIPIKINRLRYRRIKPYDSIGILTIAYPFFSLRRIYRIPEYNKEKEVSWLNAKLTKKCILKSNIQKIQILSLYKVSCIYNGNKYNRSGLTNHPQSTSYSRYIMIFSNGKSPISINCYGLQYKYFFQGDMFYLVKKKNGKNVAIPFFYPNIKEKVQKDIQQSEVRLI